MANHNSSAANGHSHGHPQPQVAVVMVPLPAQGHLNQLLHFSRLIAAAAIPVFYLGSATHIRQAKLRVHGWDPSEASVAVQFHELPTPPFENPPPDPNAPTKFPSHFLPSLAATTNLRAPVYEFVNEQSKKFRRVVVIYDSLMTHVVQDVDSVQNCESYCFRSISAFTLLAFNWEARGKPELPAEAEILKLIPASDGCFPPEFSEFKGLQLQSQKSFSGDIYNSSRLIEGVYLDILEKVKITGAEKVWALGPFNPTSIQCPISRTRHKCLEWLDKQGPDSVIFVSFGTTSSLSDEQIRELAMGLDNSRQNFVWVLRDADRADIFTGDVRRAELPEGFEDRVEGRGIVVRDWAPQLEILSHSSTGCFMSHCGWNSCIESISNGVAIAAWPMHSDQPRNAFLVTRVLGIGLEVRDWGRRDELVTAETVADVVRRVMVGEEGDGVRKRAKDLGSAVRSSMMEGGACKEEMEAFTSHISR